MSAGENKHLIPYTSGNAVTATSTDGMGKSNVYKKKKEQKKKATQATKPVPLPSLSDHPDLRYITLGPNGWPVMAKRTFKWEGREGKFKIIPTETSPGTSRKRLSHTSSSFSSPPALTATMRSPRHNSFPATNMSLWRRAKDLEILPTIPETEEERPAAASYSLPPLPFRELVNIKAVPEKFLNATKNFSRYMYSYPTPTIGKRMGGLAGLIPEGVHGELKVFKDITEAHLYLRIQGERTGRLVAKCTMEFRGLTAAGETLKLTKDNYETTMIFGSFVLNAPSTDAWNPGFWLDRSASSASPLGD